MAIAFLPGALPGCAHAEGPDNSRIDAYMSPLVKRDEFSGSLLIAKDGKIIANRSYGQANIEHGTRNQAKTAYRIGSLTKQFTAMAILILHERGRLDIDAPMCNYLKNCPEAWRGITIHQLMSHTAGIKDYSKLPGADRYRQEGGAQAEIIATFRDLPLTFRPGSSWNYCNSGYYLLGVIIENVSGRSYARFLQKNIFDPLGMKNTAYPEADSVPLYRAIGYIPRGASLTQWNDRKNVDFTFAAGALQSTVEDLLLWDQALYSDKLVSKKTLGLMFAPHTKRYGYGWYLADRKGRNVALHSGRLLGFSSYIERSLDDKVCVIILSNLGGVPLRDIAADLLRIAFGNGYGALNLATSGGPGAD